ncbi:type II restriction endonuclease [Oenococcus alcoholitolerans]|uniref:type II restriction endonuclease n=1 Tax=Oenococcus alcoholitolerans TaxID=931074 RepID=UPI003F6EF7C0
MQKPELLYQNWYIHSEDRLRAFNKVKKGTKKIISTIREASFPRDLHGSALEEVMDIICEQQEIFKGAKHAFMWKPKMRIPDIYENRDNQIAFADMLNQVINTNQEIKMLMAVEELDKHNIKGLGPAVANILYFLKPDIFPPFNTSIVKGYNFLTNSKIKLGKWSEYFKLRDGIIELNQAGGLFSKDLGAISGLLFDIGKGNYVIRENIELVTKEQISGTKRKIDEKLEEQEIKNLHQRIQYILAEIGNNIGYHAWIASNDHNRTYKGFRLGDYSLPSLPKDIASLPHHLQETIGLIDVIWFSKENKTVAAFEVEKSTSIMSGMNRMDDLYQAANNNEMMLYIVVPERRENKVLYQFSRPHYMHSHHLHDRLRYILFKDLIDNFQSIKRFGKDFSVLSSISHFPDGRKVKD